MNEAGIFLLFGLVVVVVVFFAWLSWKQERERTAALGALAQRLKWSFSGEEKDGDFDGRYAQFGCFQRGHSRYAHNQMRGTIDVLGREVQAQAGDYHYKITRSNGKSSSTTTYRFSYFLVKLPFGSSLPSIALRSEGFMDKIAGAIGFDDIDFESAEFSRRYHVSGSDRKFVYDVIHPRMIDWMLDAPPPAFEVTRGVLLLVGGERWDTDEFEGAMGWAEAFFSHWPEYLVKDIEARRV
ncbi:MAG: hypothetical protein ACAH89_09385 [Rariglobus sp.]|nr:hypothetical protein [Rariglobus sp.]